MDYESLSKSGWGEIPDEVILPAGRWRLANNGIALFKGKDGKSDRVGFFYNPVQPLSGISAKDMKALDGVDYSANEVGTKDVFFLSGVRDQRKVMHHIEKHTGLSLATSEPLIVVEDGNPKINPAVREALKGTLVDAQLGVDEYNGESRNVASEFSPAAK